MELCEMIKVMQHYENGGEVEYIVKEDVYPSWSKCVNPLWDWFEYDYRIKEPKQKVTIEKWLCQDRKNDYIVVETSSIEKYVLYKKVKLLKSYEVEL